MGVGFPKVFVVNGPDIADYEDLANLPAINSVLLLGNKTDKRHSSVIQKYGCLFKSIGYFSKKDISIEEQNSIWDMLVRNGAITGETRRNTRARK
jgi:hypothetical protein